MMKNLTTLILLLVSATAFSQISDSANFFYQKGLEEKTAKRWLVASQYFERAARLNPRFVDAYLENGNVNIEMRRTDVAKTNFSKVLDLQPGNVPASSQLIGLYYDYHQFQNAIDLAQKCTSCPGNEKTIALCYFNLQDYPTAEKMLVKLAKSLPNDAEVVYTLGRTYMEMEYNQKAIFYYQKAISLKPDVANWNFDLGMLYFANEKYENAVVFLNKAVALGFTVTAEFKENLGYAYLYGGDFAKGESILLDLHNKKPGDKDLIRDMAYAYYKKGMYDKSLDFCQKLLELDPKDARALYQAGLSFQKLGNTQKGMQMCDKAIDMDPTLKGLRTKRGGDDF